MTDYKATFGFTSIPNSFWTLPVSSVALRVLGFIMVNRDRNPNKCSARWMAICFDLSVKTIIKAINELEELLLIKVYKSPGCVSTFEYLDWNDNSSKELTYV